MRLVVGFVIGTLFAGLILGIISGGISVAQTDDDSDLTTLLPDIGKIYRTSLASPFQQVEQEIEDEDIAAFYRRLMEKTGLTQIPEE
ncbi:MAG: hypothetical protein JSV77_09220 [Dehalococcoidales bacterium]|nr:MAG: hypothetical protein JSV77_09220 [Dehalococcoidales bacterium]